MIFQANARVVPGAGTIDRIVNGLRGGSDRVVNHRMGSQRLTVPPSKVAGRCTGKYIDGGNRAEAGFESGAAIKFSLRG